MSDVSWPKVFKQLCGLWPRYEPTDEEQALLADRFSKVRRQDLLLEAVRRHREEPEGQTRSPRIDRIHHHLQTLVGDLDGEMPKRTVRRERSEAAPMPTPAEMEADLRQCRSIIERASNAEIGAAVELLKLIGWVVPADRSPLSEVHTRCLAAAIDTVRMRRGVA